MYTVVKKVRNQVLRNLHQISFIRNQGEVNYQVALKRHFRHLPALSVEDQAIVDAVNSEGVFVTSLAELAIPSTSQIIQAAQNLIPSMEQHLLGNKDDYVIHASTQQIMEHPEIFLWGLEERLLNIVENYLGLPVAYHGVYVRRDIANNVERKSRLWHIDREDRKLLKVIIYLQDTDEQSGPFQYIPKSWTASLMRSLKYEYGYLQDKTMKQVIDPSLYRSCTGLTGTVLFAATGSVFHRGKVPMTKDRYAIFFDYTSRQPKHPFYCKSSLPDEKLIELSPKLSESQRKCVFWR